MLKELIDLAEAYQELSPTRVAILKDLGRVRVEGGWETFAKGDEASLPLWLVKELIKAGYADLREQKLSDAEVGKYLMVEKSLKSGEFSPLKERFYMEVKELLKEFKESPIKTSEDALRKMRLESNVSDLVRIRLRKLVQIAFLKGEVSEFMDKILPEEKVLLNALSDVISEWLREVLGAD